MSAMAFGKRVTGLPRGVRSGHCQRVSLARPKSSALVMASSSTGTRLNRAV